MTTLTPMLAIAAVLAVGCAASTGAHTPTSRRGTPGLTHADLKFKPVDLRYGIYLARLEIHTTITPDGTLRSVRTENKSYGPRDINPRHQRIEIREGRLTPQQLAELTRLFAGWESLSSERYGGVPDGGDIQIRYGDRTVSGGSAAPRQVWDIHARIARLTARMPIVQNRASRRSVTLGTRPPSP